MAHWCDVKQYLNEIPQSWGSAEADLVLDTVQLLFQIHYKKVPIYLWNIRLLQKCKSNSIGSQ